jgi:glucosylceramidase
MWTCHSGNQNQIWEMRADGTVRGKGKCLDVRHHGTADGTTVQVWDCFAGPNQRWRATASGELRNDGSGRCLDVEGSPVDGARLQIWSCHGGDNQRWTFPS